MAPRASGGGGRRRAARHCGDEKAVITSNRKEPHHAHETRHSHRLLPRNHRAARRRSANATKGETCRKALAQAGTLWIDDGVEVGQAAGLINGAMYLTYNDKDPLVDPTAKPNMVIHRQGGKSTCG